METDIYQLVKKHLTQDIIQLADHFNQDHDQALALLENDLHSFKREKRQFKGESEKRCMARVWNNGQGAQCSRHQTNGSEFCRTHAALKQPKWCKGCFLEFKENRFHKYVWEHFGKITDPVPTCISCRQKET